MVVPPAPHGVTVKQTIDQILVTFPATTRTQHAPWRTQFRRWLGARFVFEPVNVFFYVISVVAMFAAGAAHMPPLMLGLALAGMALIWFVEKGARRDATRRQSVAAASVQLSAHRLCVDARDGSLDVALDQIEKVTVDAAGARLRVDGEARYLIPSRSEAERAWLGALLQDAVQTRAQRSQAAEADRRQLQEMLSQKRT